MTGATGLAGVSGVTGVTGPGWAGVGWAGLGWAGLTGLAGPARVGVSWTALDWAGLTDSISQKCARRAYLRVFFNLTPASGPPTPPAALQTCTKSDPNQTQSLLPPHDTAPAVGRPMRNPTDLPAMCSRDAPELEKTLQKREDWGVETRYSQ